MAAAKTFYYIGVVYDYITQDMTIYPGVRVWIVIWLLKLFKSMEIFYVE